MSRLTDQIHRPTLVGALRTPLLSASRALLRDSGSGYDMNPVSGHSGAVNPGFGYAVRVALAFRDLAPARDSLESLRPHSITGSIT
jgi:hypothetical protein